MKVSVRSERAFLYLTNMIPLNSVGSLHSPPPPAPLKMHLASLGAESPRTQLLIHGGIGLLQLICDHAKSLSQNGGGGGAKNLLRVRVMSLIEVDWVIGELLVGGERVLRKTRRIAMNPAKWLQT